MSDRKHVIAATIVTVAVSPLVFAAHEMDSLEEVEVTSPSMHKPQSINKYSLSENEIKSMRSSTSDTASLLAQVPGLRIYSAGGLSSLPSIHGLADDRLRIKVDGMDLISACGNHMNPPLSYIGASNVEAASVFAGVVPVSVGGDSIGGAIQVDSAPSEFARDQNVIYRGEAGSFYRSNNDAHGVNATFSLVTENINIRYQGSMDKANNYSAADHFKPTGLAASGRGSLAGDEVGSSMYKSVNHSLSLGLLVNKDHLLQVQLGLQDIPYQGWPNQRMDMTGNDSKRARIRYNGSYSWGALEALVYYEETRHEMQFYKDKLYWYGPNNAPGSDGIPCTPSGGKMGCAAGMPMDTEGENVGASIQGSIPLSNNHLLRIGGEGQHYTLDDWWDPSGKGMWPNTFWNINNGQRDRLALFAELESLWGDAWFTIFGVRHETVRMDADEVQGYSPMYNPGSETAFNAASRDRTDDNFDLTFLARFMSGIAGQPMVCRCVWSTW